uniref:CDP-diacylglycerol--glycerol-3-phosphate 3-phosphatidyltransferase n=1 Tax=Schistosoma haematobium TaxID=6185 RepID=A0A094ZUA8_SCHHA
MSTVVVEVLNRQTVLQSGNFDPSSCNDHIENANKRIILSTLYIGTGALENELVSALTKAVCERNVKLTILMDATRGQRPCLTTNYYSTNANKLSSTTNLLEHPIPYSSCHFLAPLTALPNVSILLYRHPSPNRWIRYILPNRWNEIFGVQHIKAYIFDDSVIMSGANLSHEYFTNRQDRMWIFKNFPNLANFYSDLIHNVISKFCYTLCSNGSLIANHYDIVSASSSSFRQQFHNALSTFLINKYQDSINHYKLNPINKSINDTYIIPLLQYGYCNIQYEKKFMQSLFQYVTSSSSSSPSSSSSLSDLIHHESFKLFLASGYFNLTKLYEKLIFNMLNSTINTPIHLLCASPMANGFLKSKGASGYIPLAYREALIQLLQLFHTTKFNHSNINVYEYTRPEWTFHAKGLWIESVDDDDDDDKKKKTKNEKNTDDDDHLPYSLSLVGSSNFSYRSLNRDLESQLCIITTNSNLCQSIYHERCHIFSSIYCSPVTLNQLIYQTEYRLPVYMRFILPIFRWYM